MKGKNNYILVLLLFILTVSCTNETLNNEPNILGVWSLKNVSGGLQGINLDYNPDLVTWSFDENKVTVNNSIISNGSHQIHSGMVSGIYDYEIKKENNIDVLYIDNHKKGVIIISLNSLKIDEGVAADGFLKTFNK